MHWQDPFEFILLLVGLIFIVAGYILYKFPPKKINYIYGYRTRASMADQESWDFAQKFSGIEMMKMGAALMATSLIASFLPISHLHGTILSMIIIILATVLMIRRVEKAIKIRKG